MSTVLKRGTLIGIVVSLLWIAAFLCLLFWKRDTLASLRVNEWGDFFAGAVAPLAFFWLVLGYAQQGEELRLNTEALKAQQEELRRQVQETAQLAAHTERQARASEQLALASKSETERAALKEIAEAQPIFRPAGGSGSGRNVTLNIGNGGASVSRLSVECPAVVRASLSPTLLFERGANGTLIFEGMPDFPFVFTISYEDGLRVKRSAPFEMISAFQFIEAHHT